MDNQIYKCICAAMADIEAIGKQNTNQKQNFKYRGIDDVYNSLHGILAKNNIFTVPEVVADRTEERTSSSGNALIYRILTIKYTFYTSDGSSISAIVVGEGMDPGDKASNKAMAIAHKYALLQIFCIPTSDDKDPDADTHVIKPKFINSNETMAGKNIIEDVFKKEYTDSKGNIKFRYGVKINGEILGHFSESLYARSVELMESKSIVEYETDVSKDGKFKNLKSISIKNDTKTEDGLPF